MTDQLTSKQLDELARPCWSFDHHSFDHISYARSVLFAAGVPESPQQGEDGMRAAMVKLSRALGHPNPVEAGPTQCVDAALIEMAAERLAVPPQQGAEPSRCKGCDLPNGCPEYCRCAPVTRSAPAAPPSDDALPPAAVAAFARVMGDPTMPPDESPAYDRWLFIKAWDAGVAAALGMEIIAPSSDDVSAPDRLHTALSAPGCERLRDYYAIGPVQRAAVESFADRLLGSAPAGVPGSSRAPAIDLHDYPAADQYVYFDSEKRTLPMYHLHTLLRHREEYAERLAAAGVPSQGSRCRAEQVGPDQWVCDCDTPLACDNGATPAAGVTEDAAMEPTELPPLPEPTRWTLFPHGTFEAYTVKQMRAYARAALAASLPPSPQPISYTDEPWQDAICEKFAAAGFKYDGFGGWRADITTSEMLALGAALGAPQPSPDGVKACRAEKRGPAEWVCDCTQMRPDCKPSHSASREDYDHE